MMRLVRIAFRNLTRNRRRTLLAAGAIIIGVAAMVTFRGFINGMRMMLLSNLIEGQTGALQVHKAGYTASLQGLPLDLDFADTEELRRKIAAIPGVTGVAPRITFGGMLSTPDRGDEPGETTYLILTAVDPAIEPKVLPRRFRFLDRGHPFAALDSPELVMSASLFDGLKLPLMDDAAHRPPVEQWPALLAGDRDGLLNGENVVVAGTLGAGLPGDRRTGLVPLGIAQRLLRMDGRITAYAISVDRLDHAARVKDALQAALGDQYEVQTWFEILPFIAQIIKIQDTVMTVIGAVFLVIVLLGILNAMLMNVLERIREIGTMMAVGVRRWQILALMVLEGAALGILGGLGGAAVGTAIVTALGRRGLEMKAPGAMVPEILHPYVTVPNVIVAGLVSVVGASLASLWPAYRASRLRPVEALRAS